MSPQPLVAEGRAPSHSSGATAPAAASIVNLGSSHKGSLWHQNCSSAVCTPVTRGRIRVNAPPGVTKAQRMSLEGCGRRTAVTASLVSPPIGTCCCPQQPSLVTTRAPQSITLRHFSQSSGPQAAIAYRITHLSTSQCLRGKSSQKQQLCARSIAHRLALHLIARQYPCRQRAPLMSRSSQLLPLQTFPINH